MNLNKIKIFFEYGSLDLIILSTLAIKYYKLSWRTEKINKQLEKLQKTGYFNRLLKKAIQNRFLKCAGFQTIRKPGFEKCRTVDNSTASTFISSIRLKKHPYV